MTSAHASREPVVPGRWSALAAFALARAAFGFQFQSMPALAPAMRADTGMGLAEIGALTGLYMAPGFFVALAGGALLQRASVRTVLAIGLAAMAAAGGLSLFADGAEALSVARLLGGFGAALATVAGVKGMGDLFAWRELPLANALAGAAQPFGIGCALAIFTALGLGVDWRAALASTGVVAAAALAAALLLAPAAPPAATARGAGVFGALRGLPRREWAALLAAGTVLAFYVGCFYGFLSLFPSMLAELGWPPARIALTTGALGWAPVLVSPAGGWLAARIGPGRVIAAGVLGWGVAVAATPWLGPTWWLILAMAVFGPAPLGAVMSLFTRAVAPERRGLGAGVFTSFLYLGAAIIPALAGAVGERAAAAGGAGPAAAVAFCGFAFLAALPALAAFERLALRETATRG